MLLPNEVVVWYVISRTENVKGVSSEVLEDSTEVT